MPTFALCPDCNHAKRRHTHYGCTADSSTCFCTRAASEIPDVEPDQPAPATMPASTEQPDDDWDAPVIVEAPAPAAPVVTAEPPTQPPLPPVENILTRAQGAGGKLATRADRIRDLLTDLDRDLAERQRVLDAERRVQELRRQLDKASAKLRELRSGTTPAPTKAAAAGREATERRIVREWAAFNGITCPAHGRIPASVTDAWHAAGSPRLGEVAA